MHSREIRKNSREILRIMPSQFEGHDLINIRVYAPKPGTDDFVPTKKGVSLAVDLIPAVIDALTLALGQPCDEAAPQRKLPPSEIDRLSQIALGALKRQGSSVHLDST